MTEKKTFKNPKLVTGWEEGAIAWHSVFEYPSPGRFLVDEWDMEVTFTKKVKAIQINSVVEDLIGNTGRVVAVQADKAWVHYYLNDSGRAVDFDCVEWLSELINVG